jgi:hypothetical protein
VSTQAPTSPRSLSSMAALPCKRSHRMKGVSKAPLRRRSVFFRTWGHRSVLFGVSVFRHGFCTATCVLTTRRRAIEVP